MKNIYLSVIMLILSITCFAQWGQVNNGITNLTTGAKLLSCSNTHLFSGTLWGQKMYKTSDNGNNWVEIQPPTVGNVPESGYYFSGKYFSGLNSSMDCVFYTTDNGTTWNTVIGGPQTTVVRGFSSLSGNIFAYTSSKGVFKSSDGGANWIAANTGLTNLNVIWMEAINTKLIAATIGGGIFVSSDNGANWVQSNTGIASGDLNTTFVWRMGTDLYYTAQGGGSYTSNNEGATWITWVKPTIMGLGINEVYRSGSNLYIETRHLSGGLKDSIFITSNEGITWTNITANLSASDLNASGITEFGGYAFIAYNLSSPGLGIYRRTTTVDITENYVSGLICVFPNPSNGKFQIKFENSALSDISQLEIYNAMGEKILQQDILTQIDLTNASKGLYFIKIYNGKSFLTKKFIIQ